MDRPAASRCLDPQIVLIFARRHTTAQTAPVAPIGALARYNRPAPTLAGYDILLNRKPTMTTSSASTVDAAAQASIGAAARELHLPTVRAEAVRLADIATRERQTRPRLPRRSPRRRGRRPHRTAAQPPHLRRQVSPPETAGRVQRRCHPHPGRCHPRRAGRHGGSRLELDRPGDLPAARWLGGPGRRGGLAG